MTLLQHPALEAAPARAPAVDLPVLELLPPARPATRRRGWIVRRMLLTADLTGLMGAFLLAEVLAGVRAGGIDAISVPAEATLFVLTLPLWVVLAKLYGLYDHDEERAAHTTVDEIVGVFHMVTVGAWIFMGATWATKLAAPGFQKLLLFWILGVAIVVTARGGARAVTRRSAAYLQNAVVVGAGEVGQLVAKTILQHPEYGINVVGFIDEDPRERSDDVSHVAVLGGREKLPLLVRLLDVERVIIAFSRESHEDTLELLRSLKGLDIQVDIVPRLFDRLGPNVGMHDVAGLPLVGVPSALLPWSSLVIKRALDVAGAVAGFLLLSPLFAYIALRIKLDSSGPVFYRDERVGRGGERFRIFKFRTMRLETCRGEDYGGADAEEMFEELMSNPALRAEFARAHKLEVDPRVTKFGRFLRRTSLDELPQLFNVLLGDLSLVGPRPVTAYEFDEYTDDGGVPDIAGVGGYWESTNVRPGVTGYWQINGRSNLEYAQRLRLDHAYAAGWSLGLDLTIMAKTARVLLARAGAC